MISGGQGVGWQIKGDEKLERAVISPRGLRELLGRAKGTVWVLTFGGSFLKVARWDKLGFWRFSERELQSSQNGPGCPGSSVSKQPRLLFPLAHLSLWIHKCLAWRLLNIWPVCFLPFLPWPLLSSRCFLPWLMQKYSASLSTSSKLVHTQSPAILLKCGGEQRIWSVHHIY